jgi:hypothetical protein
MQDCPECADSVYTVIKAVKVEAIVQKLIETNPRLKRSDRILQMLDKANTFKGSDHFQIRPVKQEFSQVNDWEDLFEPSKFVKKNEL